jgi:hypothetical protein
VFVSWRISARPRAALYVQGAGAAYGALIVVRFLFLGPHISIEESTPAVVLSYALVLMIGVFLLLGFAAVWMVDRCDRDGRDLAPLPGA